MSQDMSATWAMLRLSQDDIRRHLSWRASFALALQMLWRKISRHMTKIDSQSQRRQHVGCCPKQGDTEWREDMSANMSPTFPTKNIRNATASPDFSSCPYYAAKQESCSTKKHGLPWQETHSVLAVNKKFVSMIRNHLLTLSVLTLQLHSKHLVWKKQTFSCWFISSENL